MSDAAPIPATPDLPAARPTCRAATEDAAGPTALGPAADHPACLTVTWNGLVAYGDRLLLAIDQRDDATILSVTLDGTTLDVTVDAVAADHLMTLLGEAGPA